MAGTITSIRVQKKNPRRANLYLDGKFVLGLSIEVVGDFGLRRGQVLSEQDMEALREAEGQGRAYEDAQRLLSYRARSTAEVRQRLARKGYQEGQIEAVITRLAEQGFLDDRAFARAWVEGRLALHPRGRYGLSSELRRKGLPKEIIEEVLDELVTEEGESAQALDLARKRAGAMAGLERPAFFRRLRGFLARRGFPSGVVGQVVRQVWEETEGGEE
jgi:regulatory protein